MKQEVSGSRTLSLNGVSKANGGKMQSINTMKHRKKREEASRCRA